MHGKISPILNYGILDDLLCKSNFHLVEPAVTPALSDQSLAESTN